MANAIELPTAGSQAILERIGRRIGLPTAAEARTGNEAMAAWVSMPAQSVALTEDVRVGPWRAFT